MSAPQATLARRFWWVALVFGLVGAMRVVTSTQEIFDSPDLHRWGREATASDLPRTWFDGHVGPLGEAKRCFIRQDHHEGSGKTWHWIVDKYLAPDSIPVEASHGHFTVGIGELGAEGLTLPESESLPYDPTIHTDDLRFVEVCVAEGDRVTVDGCVEDGRLRGCSPGETAGTLRPSGTLAQQREARIRASSRGVWGAVLAPLAFLFIVWAYDVGFPFAKRVRVRAAVRRRIRGNMLLGAALALVAPAVCLARGAGLPSLSLALVPAFVVPFVFWRARAIRAVLRDLRRPPRGSAVLEGRVAEDSPLGKRALADEPVAFSLVEVHRYVAEARGGVAGYRFVGEVQDVGELRVIGAFGRATVPVDDAVVELDVDTEVVVPGSEVPPEIAESLEIDRDERYRLRERCLKPGDRISVVVEGELLPASEGEAYRSAPAGLNLAGGARPVIFEGTKDAALRRLGRQALALEALVFLFLGLGLGACAWGLAVARTLR